MASPEVPAVTPPTLALIAHDGRKTGLRAFATWNRVTLSPTTRLLTTRLLTTRPGLGGCLEGCVAVGMRGTWRLRGSLHDPLLAWTQSGTKPDGSLAGGRDGPLRDDGSTSVDVTAADRRVGAPRSIDAAADPDDRPTRVDDRVVRGGLERPGWRPRGRNHPIRPPTVH